MLWQTQHTRPYFIIRPWHLSDILPFLCVGVIAMDYIRITVILLAVSTQQVKLSLQYRASCRDMWHSQRRECSPGVGRWTIHLAGKLVNDSHVIVCGDSSRHVQVFTQALHAVMSSRFAHACQLGASCLWVIQKHRRETQLVGILPSRDEDLSFENFRNMPAQR